MRVIAAIVFISLLAQIRALPPAATAAQQVELFGEPTIVLDAEKAWLGAAAVWPLARSGSGARIAGARQPAFSPARRQDDDAAANHGRGQPRQRFGTRADGGVADPDAAQPRCRHRAARAAVAERRGRGARHADSARRRR